MTLTKDLAKRNVNTAELSLRDILKGLEADVTMSNYMQLMLNQQYFEALGYYTIMKYLLDILKYYLSVLSEYDAAEETIDRITRLIEETENKTTEIVSAENVSIEEMEEAVEKDYGFDKETINEIKEEVKETVEEAAKEPPVREEIKSAAKETTKTVETVTQAIKETPAIITADTKPVSTGGAVDTVAAIKDSILTGGEKGTAVDNATKAAAVGGTVATVIAAATGVAAGAASGLIVSGAAGTGAAVISAITGGTAASAAGLAAAAAIGEAGAGSTASLVAGAAAAGGLAGTLVAGAAGVILGGEIIAGTALVNAVGEKLEQEQRETFANTVTKAEEAMIEAINNGATATDAFNKAVEILQPSDAPGVIGYGLATGQIDREDLQELYEAMAKEAQQAAEARDAADAEYNPPAANPDEDESGLCQTDGEEPCGSDEPPCGSDCSTDCGSDEPPCGSDEPPCGSDEPPCGTDGCDCSTDCGIDIGCETDICVQEE